MNILFITLFSCNNNVESYSIEIKNGIKTIKNTGKANDKDFAINEDKKWQIICSYR